MSETGYGLTSNAPTASTETSVPMAIKLSIVAMCEHTEDKRNVGMFLSMLPKHPSIETVLCFNHKIGNSISDFPRCVESKRENNIVYVENFYKEFEFDTARNNAKMFAAGEWILSLDLDEMLATQIDAILVALAQVPNNIDGIVCTNLSHIRDDRSPSGAYVRDTGYATRLFRNKPHIKWQSRCHETVDFAIGSDRLFDSTITILHSGYDTEIEDLADKLKRNIRLLAKEISNPRSAETDMHAFENLIRSCVSINSNILERAN